MTAPKIDPLKRALERIFGLPGQRNEDQKRVYKYFIEDPMLRTSVEEKASPQTSRDLALSAYKKAFKPEN